MLCIWPNTLGLGGIRALALYGLFWGISENLNLMKSVGLSFRFGICRPAGLAEIFRLKRISCATMMISELIARMIMNAGMRKVDSGDARQRFAKRQWIK